MNLLLSDEQQMIADAIGDVLLQEYPLDRLHGGSATMAPNQWQQIAELGWLGLGLDDGVGGVGYGLAEEMLLCRASQRHLLSPSLLAAILGAHVAAVNAPEAVAGIVAGETTVALAVPRKPVSLLEDLLDVELLLIDPENAEYVLLWDTEAAVMLSASQLKQVAVAGVDNSIGLSVASGSVAPFVRATRGEADIYARALVLLAAMETGLAEGVRDMAVDYAKVREQFGQAIGAFQAIKHACADMACRVEAADCQLRMAVVSQSSGETDLLVQAAAARLLAGEAARENATRNIQVHGAMGYTAECNAHWFLKRARLLEQVSAPPRHLQRHVLGLPVGRFESVG
ncbi:acyl-CoA dehydrogenase [Spongiibacter sp. KMU-166]|uniref:Acyl-CoA dehydrogenase n=1 Tax=Spongiibacter thalassae TaxID=2721624 RepID=A0ABX1GC33_9GAMM|nr:acyl-CoA dehydrogenase [Spongiibacter thalassae]